MPLRISLFFLYFILLLSGCTEQSEDKILSLSVLFEHANQKHLDAQKLEFEAAQITAKYLNADSTTVADTAIQFHNFGRQLIDSTRNKAAEILFQQAIALRKNIYPDSNQIDILRAKHNLAYAQMQRTNDFQQALDSYISIEDKFSSQLPVLYFVNNMRIGYAYWKLGDFILAKRYFEKVLQFSNTPPGSVIPTTFFCEMLGFYSACLRENGELEQALEKGEKALQITLDNNLEKQKGGSYLIVGNVWQDSMMNIEDIHSESYLQAQQKAILHTQLALENYEQYSQIQQILLTITNLGEIYRRTTHYDDAKQTLLKGLVLANKYKVPGRNHSGLLINLGEVFYDTYHYDKAIECYKRASFVLRKEPNKSYLGIKPMEGTTVERLTLLSDLPEAYLAKYIQNSDPGMLEIVARHYDTLFEQINFLRSSLISDQSKLDLARKAQKWVRKAFDGNMRLYSLVSAEKKGKFLEKAFQLSEQSKSFALLEATRLQTISRFLPKQLRQEERNLMQLAANTNPSNAQVEQFEKAKRLYVKHLKEQKPEYFALKYKGPDLSIKDIQGNLLEKNQAMLTYFCQDSALYSFYIDTKGKVEVDSTQINKKVIQNNVKSMLELLNDPYRADGKISLSKDSSLLELSYFFYKLLFNRKWLKTLPERIIIIPDDALYNLPFDALVTVSPQGKMIAELTQDSNFTVFKHAFSYCFSANVLMEMEKQVVPTDLKRCLAILAPARKEPNVKIEVEAIEKNSTFTCLSFSDKESTKENFWKACNQYAYIHVAAHAFVRPNPDSNYLKFWPSNKEPSDTALFLHELYRHRFHQELINLSACETASGAFQEGEGNFSLARGLAHGGIRSILSTLWRVPTDGKAFIMPGFYAQLQSTSKDVALQEAKCSFLKNGDFNHHPQNWAGYVLIGTSTNSKRGFSAFFAITLIIGCVLAIGGFFFLNRNKKKKKTL